MKRDQIKIKIIANSTKKEVGEEKKGRDEAYQ